MINQQLPKRTRIFFCLIITRICDTSCVVPNNSQSRTHMSHAGEQLALAFIHKQSVQHLRRFFRNRVSPPPTAAPSTGADLAEARKPLLRRHVPQAIRVARAVRKLLRRLQHAPGTGARLHDHHRLDRRGHPVAIPGKRDAHGVRHPLHRFSRRASPVVLFLVLHGHILAHVPERIARRVRIRHVPRKGKLHGHPSGPPIVGSSPPGTDPGKVLRKLVFQL
mmetsp:Transcript_13272/g.32438  ORF Transcript_13272/g.32438 Transcript_13272/m.32438 type:complete len:221 (+) Transcript_13272:805-1467(+)